MKFLIILAFAVKFIVSHSHICGTNLKPDFGYDEKPEQDTKEAHEYLDRHGPLKRTSRTCRRPDLYKCPICCGHICCEDVDNLPVQAPDFRPGEQLWVPLRFIFLLKENQSPWFTKDLIWNELKVVNSEFKRFDIPVRVFYNESIYVHNDAYASGCDTQGCAQNSNCEFLTEIAPKLVREPTEIISIFMCSGLPVSGVSTYAWSNYETDPRNFIILEKFAVMPRRYNWVDHIGKSLIHEFGHYFGLLHTFEPSGVCDGMGDFVNDTPVVKSPGPKWIECEEPYDSCPNQPGLDAKDNYMDYFWQRCQNKFTLGQLTRMRKSIRVFKPLLRVNTLIQSNHVVCTKDALFMQNCTLLTKHCVTNSQSCQLLQPMRGKERTDLIQHSNTEYNVLNTYNRYRGEEHVFFNKNLSAPALLNVVFSTGFKLSECQHTTRLGILAGEPLLIVKGSGLTKRNLYLENCIYYRAEKSVFVFSIPRTNLVAVFSNTSDWVFNFRDDDILGSCHATVVRYCAHTTTSNVVQYIKLKVNKHFRRIVVFIALSLSAMLVEFAYNFYFARGGRHVISG